RLVRTRKWSAVPSRSDARSSVYAEMAEAAGFSLVFTQFIFHLTFTSCMEVDVCIPIRLDHQMREKLSHRQVEQMDGKHVVFRLSAFRQEFYLQLTPDSSFLAAGSESAASNASTDFRGCFYSGDVNADPDSFAAVSLCRGLQGGFSYKGMEYFITTSTENAAVSSENRNFLEITHIISRRMIAAHSGANFTSRCGVTPDNNVSVSLEKYRHLHQLDADSFTESVLKSLGRSKRFSSIPRFVEVLVVADQSMAAFHGDDLKHYLLTLMSVAARLYKHPSILNSINIVVVGFMVINEADKGPKVSSNAALTLRNFCSWQKKLNKPSDKHPEYWDTAILFTKQVTACWTCLKSSSLSRTVCPGPATACTVSVSSPLAQAPNPVPTCSPAQSCGAPGALVDSRSVKPGTFPGQTAQAVYTAKSATEAPVLISTAQCISSNGYNFVVTLPIGASNIDIRQRGYRGMVSDENYLAVKNHHGKYLLNGNYVVSAAERDLLLNGSLLRYSGTSTSVEILQVTRPLQEPLTVEVLSVGKMTPPRIRYSFYISKERKEEKNLWKEEKSHKSQNSVLIDDKNTIIKNEVMSKAPVSHWVTAGWDSCTVTCGNGLQKRLVQCQSIEGHLATDCDSTKRPAAVRACGDPCPMWEVGSWSQCSKSCGRGFKRRPVRCITETGLNLQRNHCSGKRKPQELDLCNLTLC
ncbi:hypothetical protein GOODEAATRI_005731, partial [Goodea atripinnis]